MIEKTRLDELLEIVAKLRASSVASDQAKALVYLAVLAESGHPGLRVDAVAVAEQLVALPDFAGVEVDDEVALSLDVVAGWLMAEVIEVDDEHPDDDEVVDTVGCATARRALRIQRAATRGVNVSPQLDLQLLWNRANVARRCARVCRDFDGLFEAIDAGRALRSRHGSSGAPGVVAQLFFHATDLALASRGEDLDLLDEAASVLFEAFEAVDPRVPAERVPLVGLLAEIALTTWEQRPTILEEAMKNLSSLAPLIAPQAVTTYLKLVGVLYEAGRDVVAEIEAVLDLADAVVESVESQREPWPWPLLESFVAVAREFTKQTRSERAARLAVRATDGLVSRAPTDRDSTFHTIRLLGALQDAYALSGDRSLLDRAGSVLESLRDECEFRGGEPHALDNLANALGRQGRFTGDVSYRARVRRLVQRVVSEFERSGPEVFAHAGGALLLCDPDVDGLQQVRGLLERAIGEAGPEADTAWRLQLLEAYCRLYRADPGLVDLAEIRGLAEALEGTPGMTREERSMLVSNYSGFLLAIEDAGTTSTDNYLEASRSAVLMTTAGSPEHGEVAYLHAQRVLKAGGHDSPATIAETIFYLRQATEWMTRGSESRASAATLLAVLLTYGASDEFDDEAARVAEDALSESRNLLWGLSSHMSVVSALAELGHGLDELVHVFLELASRRRRRDPRADIEALVLSAIAAAEEMKSRLAVAETLSVDRDHESELGATAAEVRRIAVELDHARAQLHTPAIVTSPLDRELLARLVRELESDLAEVKTSLDEQLHVLQGSQPAPEDYVEVLLELLTQTDALLYLHVGAVMSAAIGVRRAGDGLWVATATMSFDVASIARDSKTVQAMAWRAADGVDRAGAARTVDQTLDRLTAPFQRVLFPWFEALARTSVSRMLVVPSGELHRMPIHAVSFSGSARLVDRFEVTYAPSLVLHKQMSSNSSPKSTLPPVLLAPCQDLPGSYVEALAADALGWTTYVGDDATGSCLSAPSESVAVCTRAEEGGSGTVLVLGGGHYLDIEVLLTLRATGKRAAAYFGVCAGHVGVRGAGDQLTGLTRAAVSAGVNVLVTTLWPVDDFAAAFVGGRSRELVQHGHTIASALRQATIELRDGGWQAVARWMESVAAQAHDRAGAALALACAVLVAVRGRAPAAEADRLARAYHDTARHAAESHADSPYWNALTPIEPLVDTLLRNPRSAERDITITDWGGFVLIG